MTQTMTIALLFHAFLVASFSIRILLRDDFSPPARLAWFIVLNVLPYFGSVAYFLFGEIDLGNAPTDCTIRCLPSCVRRQPILWVTGTASIS